MVQQHPYGAADWDTVASQPWRMALPQKPIFGAVMPLGCRSLECASEIISYMECKRHIECNIILDSACGQCPELVEVPALFDAS